MRSYMVDSYTNPLDHTNTMEVDLRKHSDTNCYEIPHLSQKIKINCNDKEKKNSNDYIINTLQG